MRGRVAVSFLVLAACLIFGPRLWAHAGSAQSNVSPFGPIFNEHPQCCTNLRCGGTVTLAAHADGVPSPTYQWFFAGNPILNEVHPTLTIGNMSPAQAGTYFVRASGFNGSVDSSPAVVTYLQDCPLPVALRAFWSNDTTLVLTFDKAVAHPSDDPFSYDLIGGPTDLVIDRAAIVNGQAGSNVVVLTMDGPRDMNTSYMLHILFGGDPYGNEFESPITLTVAAPFVVLPFEVSWQFNQTGADLGTAWKEVSYATDGWSAGRGVLGREFDATPELASLLRTELIAPADGGPVTVYFRTHFTLTTFEGLAGLSLRYFYDDAFVAYLNGTEVLRRGVPVGQDYRTSGVSHEATNASGPSEISLEAAVPGDNVLAVELHSAGATSSDCVWGAEVTALGVPNREIIILEQPISQTLNHEGTTFEVTAVGPQPMIWQWQRNNIDIPGATNSSLTVRNEPGYCDLGFYRAVISTPFGTTNSLPAFLFVGDPPARPTVISAVGGTNRSEILLTFDSWLSGATAEVITNYMVRSRQSGATLPVHRAVLVNSTNVLLQTEPRLHEPYQVIINGVSSDGTCPNLITPNSTVDVLQTIVLLPESASWRFDERNIDQGTAWKESEYNDLGWALGQGVFGIDPDAADRGILFGTPLQLTFPTEAAQTSTFYFRTHFNFNSGLHNTTFLLRILYDDGVIIYLNGTETWRSPSLAGVDPVTHQTFAKVQHEGEHWDVVTLDPANLRPTENVIAVELHQATPTSSDVVLGLVLEALLRLPVERSFLQIRHLPADSHPTAQIEVRWVPVTNFILVESATVEGPYTPVAGNPQGVYRSAPSPQTRYFQLRSQ